MLRTIERLKADLADAGANLAKVETAYVAEVMDWAERSYRGMARADGKTELDLSREVDRARARVKRAETAIIEQRARQYLRQR